MGAPLPYCIIFDYYMTLVSKKVPMKRKRVHSNIELQTPKTILCPRHLQIYFILFWNWWKDKRANMLKIVFRMKTETPFCRFWLVYEVVFVSYNIWYGMIFGFVFFLFYRVICNNSIIFEFLSATSMTRPTRRETFQFMTCMFMKCIFSHKRG